MKGDTTKFRLGCHHSYSDITHLVFKNQEFWAIPFKFLYGLSCLKHRWITRDHVEAQLIEFFVWLFTKSDVLQSLKVEIKKNSYSLNYALLRFAQTSLSYYRESLPKTQPRSAVLCQLKKIFLFYFKAEDLAGSCYFLLQRLWKFFLDIS